MSVENGQNATPTVTPAKQYAVIQTGYVTKSGEPVVFKDDDGNKTPQIIRILSDRTVADKMRSRLTATHSRVAKINGNENRTAQPLYGVAEIEGTPPRARKPMTEEQKRALVARMQAGRKRGKGK